jgi:hypothetical protein
LSGGVTYDTGALIAAEAYERGIWSLHDRMLLRGIQPTVPAGVLGQAWRGGPQPGLSRFLRGCRVEDLSQLRSRAAGEACGRAGSADVIDASVVVGAVVRGDLVVSSDVGDIEGIASALGASLDIVPVSSLR